MIHRGTGVLGFLLLFVGSTTLTGCSYNEIIDPAPASRVEPTGFALAQQTCPKAGVFSTSGENPILLLRDDTRSANRHMTCIMKSLGASHELLREVNHNAERASGLATYVKNPGNWVSKTKEWVEGDYVYRYTFASSGHSLRIAES